MSKHTITLKFKTAGDSTVSEGWLITSLAGLDSQTRYQFMKEKFNFDMYSSMSEKEYKDAIKGMEAFTKELCKSKKKALAYLVRAGICTPTGRLTKNYK